MPQTKSQIKNIKIILRNRISNKRYKLAIKQATKHYLLNLKNIDDNKNEANILSCRSNLSKVYKTIDKAVKKNILHKNTASRRKAKLSKLLNQIIG